jgi:DNA ligase-1
MSFKPLLAADVELAKLKFPLMASPKLDGVRATFVGPNHTLLTRSLKPIPNMYVNIKLRLDHPLDGELVVGEAFGKSVFRDTMKVISSHEAPIRGLTFRVFDYVMEGVPFNKRFQRACLWCDFENIIPVPHVDIENMDQLLLYEERMLEVGYEGVMLRDPFGMYKYGRSTANEGILLKLKRKLTSEAEVIGFQERMHNANELKTDKLGYAERSSHQANMVPMGTMGALLVRDLKTGVEFNVGTGFSDQERQQIWDCRESFLGAVASYEYLPIGVKDKPRHPCFKGWRMKQDIV